MPVKPIPDGYNSVTPYLVIKGAAEALEFYKSVFGATELMRFDGPNGTLAHAEIKIGNSPIMISDEWPDMGFRGPKSIGGSPVGIMIYVEDADAMFAKAVATGATATKPLQDQFYGDRSGSITDPWGHMWTIATHVEDVSPEEIERRMSAMTPQAA
ncbi:MAG TPA: VOC family protein [Gemmataceae bacterium]|nr:VOC family protein [Gemmataceae bacterium]